MNSFIINVVIMKRKKKVCVCTYVPVRMKFRDSMTRKNHEMQNYGK